MERLTTHAENSGQAIVDCDACKKAGNFCHLYTCRNMLKDRLCESEDILGPTYDLSRIKELVEAYREGRCNVFTCTPGDKLYKVWKVNGQNRIAEFVVTKISSAMPGIWMVSFTKPGSGLHRACNVEEIGKTVFLTREAADKDLEEQNG